MADVELAVVTAPRPPCLDPLAEPTIAEPLTLIVFRSGDPIGRGSSKARAMPRRLRG